MLRSQGIEIGTVNAGSPAASAGLQAGDVIVEVNGQRVLDLIDFMFHSHEEELDIEVIRKERRLSFHLQPGPDRDIGIEAKPFRIKTCANKCVFCFVSQLPKGLRRSLYIKDEDYRMSFLYGNYVTLTNLSAAEKKRIVEQRLSPLYISVHSTDRAVRNALLGNPKAPDILGEIRFFKEHRIRMHSQIVLCPGYNDGKNLEQTIRDLYKFYPYIASIAVVPVGLTSHRKSASRLRPVEREDALQALKSVESFQRRFRKRHGDSIVYGADELYIHADAAFPPLSDYGELPQVENGVGMVPLFLSQARKVRIPAAAGGKRFLTFTGVSFYPFLSKLIERFRKAGIDIEAVPIENNLFGKSVTVTGLLTGRVVMRAFADIVKKDDVLLIPDIVMRDGEEVFLDDVSRKDVEDLLGIKTVLIEPTPKGLADAVASLA